MLAVNCLPSIEDVIAQTGDNLEEIMIGINILIAILVFLDPVPLLLGLRILQVEFQQKIRVAGRNEFKKHRGEQPIDDAMQSFVKIRDIRNRIPEITLHRQNQAHSAIIGKFLHSAEPPSLLAIPLEDQMKPMDHLFSSYEIRVLIPHPITTVMLGNMRTHGSKLQIIAQQIAFAYFTDEIFDIMEIQLTGKGTIADPSETRTAAEINQFLCFFGF